MNKLYVVIALLFLMITSCSHEVTLSTVLINKHFSLQERKELAKIVAFADSLVLSKTDFDEIDKSYHQYLELRTFVTGDSVPNLWAFEEKMKYEFLFSLDTCLFNEIWRISTAPGNVSTKDTTLYYPTNFHSIELTNLGVFAKYIHDLGEKNEYYKGYSESMEISGSLSPSMIAGFLLHHNEFDFNNMDNHLWVAVFVLTLEESLEKKVQRCLDKETNVKKELTDTVLLYPEDGHKGS